ncbi:MAG: xanthine dehydrogenase FAD-binding subunit XdhB [Eubacteriales bacterium]|nr:xanthine dehydrogenase FAD-binding subunit XdhB [Eubacteriales bacterium]
MYDIERFHQAVSVEDAIAALRADESALVISGGTDVLIQCREGKLAGCSLVSVNGLKELQGVTEGPDGEVVIGAATVFSHITNSPLVRRTMPMLGEAVDQVGGPQIRNMGTIGGNVCNGVTSADSASSLFALNAVLELRGGEGTRRVPIAEFYTGPGKTVRKHDELLVALHIARKDYEGFGGRYLKYGKRGAMEIATLGCAAMVKLAADKQTVEELRLAYGVAGPTPLRCHGAEEAARGKALGAALYDEIAQCALNETHPRDSWRASKVMRQQLIAEMARRAVQEAAVRAGGKADV